MKQKKIAHYIVSGFYNYIYTSDIKKLPGQILKGSVYLGYLVNIFSGGYIEYHYIENFDRKCKFDNFHKTLLKNKKFRKFLLWYGKNTYKYHRTFGDITKVSISIKQTCSRLTQQKHGTLWQN